MAEKTKITIEPLDSWYKPPILTKRQAAYVNSLSKIFNVRSMKYGQIIPYHCTPWQIDFHANSICALPRSQWKDRLVVKGRGISFSWSSMIDMLMAFNKYDNIIFPIVSHKYETACDLIKVGYELAELANIDLGIDLNKQVHGVIKNKYTGSEIRAYPSSNTNALRSLRTYTGIMDEVNFFRNAQQVFDAAENTINQGGMFTIGSTVYDRNDYFWQLYQKLNTDERRHIKRIYNLPVFDPTKFSISRPIPDQIREGLKPIVWWIDTNTLEMQRLRDEAGFLRENMCLPSDESVKFLPIQFILSCTDKSLENHSVFKSDNPLFAGVDVATSHDYAVIAIFEKTEFGFVQRHLWYSNKIEIQDLQYLVETLNESFKLSAIRVDMTGMGTDITQRLKRKLGAKVEGVHFGSSVRTAQYGVKQRVREKMANNLKLLMVDGRIKLIQDDMQIRQLNSWKFDLKTCDDPDGHGDIFWACALAVMDFGWKMPKLNSMSNAPVQLPDIIRQEVDWGDWVEQDSTQMEG